MLNGPPILLAVLILNDLIANQREANYKILTLYNDYRQTSIETNITQPKAASSNKRPSMPLEAGVAVHITSDLKETIPILTERK